ncbi:hypothetical protein [Pseudoblastomonas halimionae]|uniref:Uncharacterized protein n=1 Tax=Alteriqipengyuania halimionae TaxID=1926630 RepID=A0A6I4U194_9SPHN|nr:hypothetical protein [Alteriqipengyuania halimionae]MXP09829.1 hypothetical protein [Alteriqipengyuania halimionae]
MPEPSPQHPDLMGGPPLSARVAYEEWQAHVDAGRIGKRPSTTPAQLLRIMRNEQVLLGRAVSFL